MAVLKVSSPSYLEQMKRLVANWPVDAERGSMILREYETVWNDVGESRFRRGVDSIIATAPFRFFPSQAEFRGYVPGSERAKFCGKCDAGWVMVPDCEARQVYGNDTAMAAARCECAGGTDWLRRIRSATA